MQTFIFGGDGMPKTPQELERMRAVARAMGRNRTPQNVGEGIASIGDAILYRAMMSKADRAEKAGMDAANSSFADFAKGLFPDASADATTTAPVPAVTTSSVDTSLPPVEGTMANARTADRNSVQNYAGLDLKSGIRSAADALGIKPEDLATAISYETAGTFDPTKKGPRTKWGQHRGLIQFGEPQAEKYGVNWNDPLNSQLGPDGAVVKYLRDAGVKPGMGLLDIYSAINAGGVNRYDASDEKNGGAWGTVADKVKYQMDGHRKKALSLFADVTPPAAFDAQPGLTEQVPVAAVPEGFQQPDPLATSEKPTVKVAQAMSTLSPDKTSKAMTILNDPWSTPGQKAVAQAYLKRFWDEQDAAQAEQRKRSDPKYRLDLERGTLDLEKGKLELQKLKNPDKARTLTREEEESLELPVDGVYQMLPDGTIKTVREPSKPIDAINARKAEAELKVLENPPQAVTLNTDEATALGLDPTGVYQKGPDGKITMVKEPSSLKPTSTMQEYEAYRDDEIKAGRTPLGRLEYEQALRSASASRNEVNIDQKTEGAFDKKLAEKQAESFNTMADEGLNARADIEVINQLDAFLKGQGGATTGLAAAMSKWGIPVEGADDLQAATALINKLVPTQRQPGSGTMSDRDVELFKASLPSLWNQPGGNEKILGVMRGLAEYKQRQGEIADMVLMGEMSRQEARRALRDLPNPLEEFRKQQKVKKADSDAQNEFNGMSDEELEAIINGGR